MTRRRARSPQDQLGVLRRVEAKQLLFAKGDAVTHLYRIEIGAIALNKVLADGRRQVKGFAYPGDLVGLGIEGEHVMNAQAMRCLPIASLRQSIADDPARELATTRDLVLTTGHRSAVKRVAGFRVAINAMPKIRRASNCR